MFRKSLITLLLVAISPAGCKQTDGESCQVDRDCESPLICCKTAGSDTPIDRGTCMLESECSIVPDAETDTSPDGTEDPAHDAPADTADVPDDTSHDDGASPDPAPDTAGDAAGDDASDSTVDTAADDAGDDDASIG